MTDPIPSKGTTKDQLSPLVQWVNSSPETKRWYLRETLKVDTSELIWARMQAAGVSKAELAKRLGRSKAHVTQLLNGSRNMTLQTLQDIAIAIGCRADVRLIPYAGCNCSSCHDTRIVVTPDWCPSCTKPYDQCRCNGVQL